MVDADTEPHVPFGGELDRVAGQVDDDLAEPIGVDHPDLGDIGMDVQDQFQILADRAGRQGPKRFAQAAMQIGGCRVDLQPARFDRREVEDVADDPAEQFAAVADHLDVLLRLGRQVHVGEQFRGTGDPAQRRADLMADVGHELTLDPARIFGGEFGLAEFGHHAVPQRRIANEDRQPTRVFERNRVDRHFRWERRFADRPQDDFAALADRQIDPPQLLIATADDVRGALVASDRVAEVRIGEGDLIEPLPSEMTAVAGQQRLGRGVGFDDHARVIDQHDGFASRFEQRPFAGFAAAQFGGPAIAVGDVPKDHPDPDDPVLLVVLRRLEDLHPTGRSVGCRMGFDMVDGLAGAEHPIVILAVAGGDRRGVQVGIGTADHLIDRPPDAVTKRFIGIGDHAIEVFAEDL